MAARPKQMVSNSELKKRLENLEKQNEGLAKTQGEMHGRIFNGLGKELRDEIHKEVDSVRKIVITILCVIFAGIVGIVIEGRFSTAARSKENDRNYKAVLQMRYEMRRLHPGEKLFQNELGLPDDLGDEDEYK